MVEFRTRDDGVKYPIRSEVANPRENDSYTHPSRCPNCNQFVYYFQSESGGKVLFDDLGPPWPKHGCHMGNSSINFKPEDTLWNKKGLRPLVITAKRISVKYALLDVDVLPGVNGIQRKRQIWVETDNRKQFYRLLNRSHTPVLFESKPNTWCGNIYTYILNEVNGEGEIIPVQLKCVMIPPIPLIKIKEIGSIAINKAISHILHNNMNIERSKAVLSEKWRIKI